MVEQMQNAQKPLELNEINIDQKRKLIFNTKQDINQQEWPAKGLKFPQEGYNWLIFQSKSDGSSLHTYKWESAIQPPKAVVILVHGWNDSTEGFAYLAQKMSQQGIESVGFDMKGFGKSGGERGIIRSWDVLVTDTNNFYEQIAKLYKIPIFILGHSLGGLMAACTYSTINAAGVILVSPALAPNPNFNPCLRKIAKCLNACCPCVPIIGQQHGLASRNIQAEQQWFQNKNNYTGKIHVRTGFQIIVALERFQNSNHQIAIPFIILQAGIDKLVDQFQIKEFFDKQKQIDKQYNFFENAWHDMFNDPDADKIIDEITKWISKH